MLIVRSRNTADIHTQQSGHQAERKKYGGNDRKQIHRSVHPFGRLVTPGFLRDGPGLEPSPDLRSGGKFCG